MTVPSLGNICPELDIFKIELALSFFNRETIITEEIVEDVELYLEKENVILAAEVIFRLRCLNLHPGVLSQDRKTENINSTNNTPNLKPLFWLMSVLPPQDASDCKSIMDQDKYRWKVSLSDVAMVFLNWGGTLNDFNLEEKSVTLVEQRLKPHSSRESCQEEVNTVVDPHTIQTLLACLEERLPEPSAMSVEDRILLVRLLVYAALDKSHGCIYNFNRVISKVLDSFASWDQEMATVLVRGLRLPDMGSENTVYVCCCLFNMNSDRQNLTGLTACFHMLHHRYKLPAELSLSATVSSLASVSDIFQRYSVEDVYYIAQLVSSVMGRLRTDKSACSQETLERLRRWAIDTRDELQLPQYRQFLEANILHERLSRLNNECSIVLRCVHNKNFQARLENAS
ncbi:uncharacterized protein LOC124358857 [Homalodisca vitripennis]|uniref:uncharacterized protein LOC124358857 n=1 Tax=Homalodisca vitripennis TaxID=197043 RepID=UPI001EEB23D9|nr:uncharacterized protein LOC124358857 [Homalodisca vitripennis]XP_046667058.1 uncharacterized protein LOC124358857 [Homalodisca vitripennis]